MVKILKDGSQPAYGFVSPRSSTATTKTSEKNRKTGPIQFPRAKRLLKVGMEELGITEKPELTMLIYDDNRKKAAEVMQEQLRTNLGLEVRLDPRPLKRIG